MPQAVAPAVYRCGIGIVQGLTKANHGDLRPCFNKKGIQVINGKETIIR